MRLPGAGGGRAATSQSLFRGFLLLRAVGSLPCALGGGASAPAPSAQCPRLKVGSWVIKSRPRREATQWHRTHGAELRCPPSRGCRVPRGVGPHRAPPSRTGFLTLETPNGDPRSHGHAAVDTGAVPRGARTSAHAWAHAGARTRRHGTHVDAHLLSLPFCGPGGLACSASPPAEARLAGGPGWWLCVFLCLVPSGGSRAELEPPRTVPGAPCQYGKRLPLDFPCSSGAGPPAPAPAPTLGWSSGVKFKPLFAS